MAYTVRNKPLAVPPLTSVVEGATHVYCNFAVYAFYFALPRSFINKNVYTGNFYVSAIKNGLTPRYESVNVEICTNPVNFYKPPYYLAGESMYS